MAKNNPLVAGFSGLFGGGKAKKSEEKVEKDGEQSVEVEPASKQGRLGKFGECADWFEEFGQLYDFELRI